MSNGLFLFSFKLVNNPDGPRKGILVSDKKLKVLTVFQTVPYLNIVVCEIPEEYRTRNNYRLFLF